MNERIRELAFKAAGGMLSYDAEGEWSLSEKEVEKFAELIIGECAEVVREGRWMVQPSQDQLARSIKQHFGVEE